jgi:hypothetical protein
MKDPRGMTEDPLTTCSHLLLPELVVQNKIPNKTSKTLYLKGTPNKRKDRRIKKEKRGKLKKIYDQNKSSESGLQPE